jgi:hypothetical protein
MIAQMKMVMDVEDHSLSDAVVEWFWFFVSSKAFSDFAAFLARASASQPSISCSINSS